MIYSASRRVSIASALLVASLTLAPRWAAALSVNTNEEQLVLSGSDRILILAPHPDDEVLACGGIIQRAVALNLPIRIVFATYGDNNELSFLVYRKHPVIFPENVRAMGQVRHEEALKAAATLGLSTNNVIFLGYPDFGMMHLWNEHWGDDELPFRSMLTRVTGVCYPSAYRPGAPFKGEEVLRDLISVLRDFKPTKVFVSHPGDHNPDHRALYLFTRVALWDLEREMKPDIIPYLVHYRNWPKPVKYEPEMKLEPPPAFCNVLNWKISPLSPSEVEKKKTALEQHHSQVEYNSRYLLSFVRNNELFGDFSVVPIPTNQPAEFDTLDPVKSPEDQEDENLTDEEKAVFVGLEKRRIHIEGDDLVLTVQFDRPLASMVELSIFIFGYRANIPFEQMPKLHLKIGAVKHQCLNRTFLLPGETVSLSRKAREVTVRISLKTLGNPDRILTSARTYMGDVPLDWVSWRVLDMH